MDHPTALTVLTHWLGGIPHQAGASLGQFQVLSEPEGKATEESSPICDLQVTHQTLLFTGTPWKPMSEKLGHLAP